MRKRIKKGLRSIKETPREPLYAHMVRVYSNSVDDQQIIGHQLASVYTNQKGWSGYAYMSGKKVRSHVIVQKPATLGRFVREEFGGKTLRQVRQHTSGKDVLYVQSIGVDKSMRKRGIAKLMLAQYKGTTLWLHAENAGAVAAYRKMGFRDHPALREGDRHFMTK